MAVILQPNPITPDERMGLQLGALTIVTDAGAESLHRRPARAARLRVSDAATHTSAWIGRALPRFEDERFLTGAANYVDDLQRPGMLHATFARSPVNGPSQNV